MKRGRRIRTLDQLAQAAAERRSVLVWGKRFPAAVIMNWQAAQVFRQLQKGIFLNIPKKPIDLSKPPRKWIPRWLRPTPEESKPILNLPYYPDEKEAV